MHHGNPTMTRSNRHKNRAKRLVGRLLPTFDPLEFRLAMTGGLGGLAAASSASGVAGLVRGVGSNGSSQVINLPGSGITAVVAETSSTITFATSKAIDPFSVSGGDFKLVAMSSNGPTSRSIPLAESLDPSGKRLTLTLDQPLANGQYRLLLLGQNGLQEADGTVLSGGGQDVDLSDFTVKPQGLGLAGATDLGVPTSTVAVKADRLDLTTDPSSVKLYRVTLPAGHFWRLGLEVSALSDGGSLASELSLYDANGGLISTASHGLSADPSDPYLFAGVKPGTYYVAVSGVGVVPGAAGNSAAFDLEPRRPGGRSLPVAFRGRRGRPGGRSPRPPPRPRRWRDNRPDRSHRSVLRRHPGRRIWATRPGPPPSSSIPRASPGP